MGNSSPGISGERPSKGVIPDTEPQTEEVKVEKREVTVDGRVYTLTIRSSAKGSGELDAKKEEAIDVIAHLLQKGKVIQSDKIKRVSVSSKAGKSKYVMRYGKGKNQRTVKHTFRKDKKSGGIANALAKKTKRIGYHLHKSQQKTTLDKVTVSQPKPDQAEKTPRGAKDGSQTGRIILGAQSEPREPPNVQSIGQKENITKEDVEFLLAEVEAQNPDALLILARIGDPNENIKADILVELITPNKVLQYYASAAKLGKQEAISKACNYCDTISEEAKEEKRLDDIKSLLADFTDLFDGVVSNEVEKTKESLGIRSKTELENVLEEILVTEDEFLNDAKKLLAAFQRFPEVNRDDTMKKIITEINDAIKEIESFKQRINSIVKSDYTEGEKAEHLADLYQSDSFKKYIFALRKMILNEKRISEKDQNNATIWNQYLEQQTKIQSDEKTLLNTNTVNLTKFTQRLAKIPLLLRELNKHKKTPDESPQTDQKEKTPLERAIEFTQTELTKINEKDTTTMYSIISLMRNLGKDRKLAFEKPSKGKKTELLTSAKRGWSKKPSKDSQRVAEYMMTEVQKHIQAIKIQSRATEDQIEILELQDRLQELRSEVRKWRENDWFKDVLDKFPNQKLQYDSLIQEERQTA